MENLNNSKASKTLKCREALITTLKEIEVKKQTLMNISQSLAQEVSDEAGGVDLIDALINNGGELPESSKPGLFENMMVKKSNDVKHLAIERLENNIIDLRLSLGDLRTNYANAYISEVEPVIERELNQLLLELDGDLAQRIGKFVGLIQAAGNPSFNNGSSNNFTAGSGNPLNVLMAKLNEIIYEKNWKDHALNDAPDDFPGECPSLLINSLNLAITPIQEKRMLNDPKYKKSLLKYLMK